MRIDNGRGNAADRAVDPYVAEMRRRYPNYVLPPPDEARRIIDESMGTVTLSELPHQTRRERP
ncbi:MAG: hypothetical protein EPO26_17660 [Chloroflexota bacterium]|nr:MAG: hypothetical protein EPO26_17660 [Chloroflexota bacterium]